MKYIVGVDGSKCSETAAKLTSLLANGSSDSVTLYYSPPQLHFSGEQDVLPEVLSKAHHALAEAVFSQTSSATAANQQTKIDTVTGSHDPRTGLLAVAAEKKGDMLVVGARGMGRLQRLLLGSVSRAIVNAAKIPVLVARTAPPLDRPFRVLIALDASEIDVDILAFLAQLTWPKNATAEVVTVVQPMFPGEVPSWLDIQTLDAEILQWRIDWERDYQKNKEERRQQLQAECNQHKIGLPITGCSTIEGYPAQALLRHTEAEQIDLIVIGSRRLTGVSRLVLGSVSEAVLSHAPCSVLIVHQHARP